MTKIICTCGNVAIALDGPPILTAECHCTSCRDAAGRLAPRPPVQEENGGTRFVMQRKDRLRVLKGSDHLASFRLTPKSGTQRIVATCCAAPMWLEFRGGHWLSIYAARWPDGSAPAPALRTMTRDAPPGTVLSDDIHNARTQSAGFMARLFWSWVRMGFRNPQVVDVKGVYHA